MKFAIIILGFIGLCIGEAALLGAKECTYGPGFWCKSISNAKQCSAVKHCIQTIWEKQVLPEDNDDVCAICKDMVKEARDQLLSNETQEEIRQVFEGSCHLIPLAVIEEECVKLSDQFIPELIDTLASQMNPQAVCATAGLCNSARIDLLLKEQQAAPAPSEPSPGGCKDCKAFLNDVIDTVKRHSRSELLEHLLAICGRLSSLSDGCMALVQSNFQSIYDFLANGLRPNEVCELFGMCEGMFGTATVHFRKTEDEPCDFCVAVVKSWRNNLGSNTTKDEFKMILSGICHQTGKFEGECLALVDQYFEALYELMMSEIDPKEICSSVGLCGANSLFKNQVPIWPLLEMRPENHLPLSPMHPSFDANDLIGQDEANSYRHNIPLPRVSLSKSSISVSSRGENGILKMNSPFGKGESCVMCEFVLHFLQNVLSDKVSRKEIEDAVENVCHLLPHTLNEECQDYIEAYGDQLIQLIVLEIDPSTICPMMKLCPGKQVSRPSVSDSTCVLCEYAMTELDEILEDKSNEESIKEAVEQICSVLPKSISSQCKTFVDDYIEQIVDLIVNGYTPREICGQLGLCPALSGSPLSLPHPKYAQLPVSRYFVPNVFQEKPLKKSPVVTKQSTVCVVCEFVVSKIDSMILDNSTEKSIETVVDKVCVLFPSTLMHDCLAFMEEYADSLIELFVSDMEPSFVCRKLRLCKDTFQMGLPKAEVSFPVNKCFVCEETVEWADRNLSPSDSKDVVPQIQNAICQHLLGKAKQICKEIAVNYGPYLTKLLVELKDSKHVCQAMKMCPYHGPKKLLGAEKCTWGPSYWCQSHIHADACKATQHCTEHVWGKEELPLV